MWITGYCTGFCITCVYIDDMHTADFTVTVCAMLMRDLFAIAKFFVFIVLIDFIIL